MNGLSALASGVLFALGLTLSGMTLPERVLGFLDVTGAWDPTLAFVMAGALLVYAPLFRVIVKQRAPLCAEGFDLPSARRVDGKLLVGSAIFGVGWGLSGMCPGPAIVNLGSFAPEALVFCAGMLLGALAFGLYDAEKQRRSLRPPALAQAPDA